ncbi:MAG: hypothetical protein H0T43_11165, partial [Solirubrobacterales bacterium]|nr:hypothetical protein [Solirubrobacterales bacterium]
FKGRPTTTGAYRGETVLRTPIDAPARSLLGRLCVVNAGRVGVDLLGTIEPRTQTVSQTTVDGAETPVDPQLTLYEREGRRLISRLPDVLERMATFKGAFVAPWVLWILAALTFAGVPAAIVVTIRVALREDAALSAGAAQPEDRDQKAREEDLNADDHERRGQHR